MALDFSSFLGGGGGGGGYGNSGPSAATADASSGINNQAAFSVGGSGSLSQRADQTASVSGPSKPDSSAGVGNGSAGSNAILYLAVGVVGIVAIAAVLKH